MADSFPPIRVGTAGWSYEDWAGIVYPSKPARGFDRLALMACLFDANEINSTFYRIPTPAQTRDWSRRIAHNPRFSFTAKLFRGFTHERRAGSFEEKSFLAAMEPLQEEDRLGCVLLQFPMSFRNTAENRGFLEQVLQHFSRLPLAVEFRHESWDREEALVLLGELRAAFVNIDQPRLEGNLSPTSHVTSPIAYYRFHGRNAAKWFGPDTSNEERYNYLYSERELKPWVERIRDGHTILTARGAADPARGVYAILNNHFRGQAVANAIQLQNMLTGETRSVPETLLATYPSLAPSTTQAAPPAQKRLF